MRWLLALVFVASCGDASGVIGDAMVALGDAISDSGRAEAQTMLLCDSEATYRVENEETGLLSEQTLWFARMELEDAASVRGVDVVLCGRTVFGEDVVTPPCPPGATCSGVLPTSLVRADCTTAAATFQEGELFVVCGSRNVSRSSSSSLTTTSGERRAYAHVTIRR